MYTLVKPKACDHDHKECIRDAISAARKLCEERGVRLTELREQVLELIWQNHKPLGAYTLMDMLAKVSTRRVAPPTVYRALDFLLEEGLIHRINSLNAFIGCPNPEKKHQSHFLICSQCNDTVELDNPQLNQSISDCAAEAGFSVINHNVEINGICSNCKSSTSEK